MKWLLFIWLLLLYVKTSAQCTQKWVCYSNSRDTIARVYQQARDTIDISIKKIPVHLVDSIILFIESKENRRKDNQALFSNYRIFRYNTDEIILKDVQTRSTAAGPLRLYRFLLSEDFNGSDWNDDAYYSFTYTKEYGAVFKEYWKKDMRSDVKNRSVLLFDSCKSISKGHRASIAFLMGP